nr:hypothetical protein [Rhizobium leucaenae]
MPLRLALTCDACCDAPEREADGSGAYSAIDLANICRDQSAGSATNGYIDEIVVTIAGMSH